MTKEEIIQYILNSPENTNSNVLRGMLNELDNGGGSFNPVTVNFEITPPSGVEIVAYKLTSTIPATYYGQIIDMEIDSNSFSIENIISGATISDIRFYNNSYNIYDIENVVLSGNISELDGVYLITGDCTISCGLKQKEGPK